MSTRMTAQSPASSAPIRVGLMVPSNNTTMEVELLAWLPAGSTVTTVKIPRGPGLLTTETIPAYRDSAIALARQHFGKGEVDLIAYGCTAAGFISGPSGDAELSAMLTEATGLPVVTTARAMVSALQHDRRQARRRRHAVPRRGERPAGRVPRRRRNRGRPSRHVPRARCGRARAHHRARRFATLRAQRWDRIATRCSSAARSCRPTRSSTACKAEFDRPAWSSIRATAWDAVRLPVSASLEFLLVPAKAGTQSFALDTRFRGYERSVF